MCVRACGESAGFPPTGAASSWGRRERGPPAPDRPARSEAGGAARSRALELRLGADSTPRRCNPPLPERAGGRAAEAGVWPALAGDTPPSEPGGSEAAGWLGWPCWRPGLPGKCAGDVLEASNSQLQDSEKVSGSGLS